MDEMVLSIPRQAGVLVRRVREGQGLTRAQLAGVARVSERLIASLELGDAPGVQLDKLLAVCDALGIELRMRSVGARKAYETAGAGMLTHGRSSVQRDDEAPVVEPKDRSYESAWHDFMQRQGLADAPLPVPEQAQREV